MSTQSEEVVFQIGTTKQQFNVQKQVLINKSEVLERMFSGQFPIPAVTIIEDIEADTFQQMINCFNAQPLQIYAFTVFKLMYAAEKYMVDPLMKLCESFINAEILNQNVGFVFDILKEIEPFNCPWLKQKCMAKILDDPVKCLQSIGFLYIKEETLKLVLMQPKINCTHYTLLRAAKIWLEFNHKLVIAELNDVYPILKEKFGIVQNDLNFKQMYNVHGITSGNKKGIKNFQSITEDIVLDSNGQNMYLHGIVLFIGVHPQMENKNDVDAIYFTDRIIIKFSLNHQQNCFKKVIRVVTQTQSKPSTIQIMFAKEPIPNDSDSSSSDSDCSSDCWQDKKLRVEVDFGRKKYRSFEKKRMELPYSMCTLHTHENFESVVSEVLVS